MRQGQTTTHWVTASASIDAAPGSVYRIIADYHNGHPSILPDEFRGLIVERGGVGAGTIIRFEMRMMGRTQSFRAVITEPEPGRVLVETGLDGNGFVTTYSIQPGPGFLKTELTISTEVQVRTGLLGIIQRFLTTRYLSPIYQRELTLLADRAKPAAATLVRAIGE